MSEASKSISNEMSSCYDESWSHSAEMKDYTKQNALLWNDFATQMNSGILSASTKYNNVFQPMKVIFEIIW